MQIKGKDKFRDFRSLVIKPREDENHTVEIQLAEERSRIIIKGSWFELQAF